MNIHVFLDKSAKFMISLRVIRSKKYSIIRYWCCKKSSFVCRIIVEQFHGMKLMQCERDRTIFINEYTKSAKFTIPLSVIIQYRCKKFSFVCKIIVEQFLGMKLMQCERDRTVLLMNIHIFLDKSAKFTIPLGVIKSTKRSIIRYWCCKKSSFVEL